MKADRKLGATLAFGLVLVTLLVLGIRKAQRAEPALHSRSLAGGSASAATNGSVHASTQALFGKGPEPSEVARQAGWPSNTLAWQASPIDLRYLSADDRPAGKRGRVVARGDALVYPDGKPARFWGANIQARALFLSDKPAVERDAARLAAFGFNLVRIHHHDSDWVVPNVLGSEPGSLAPEQIDKIDWWVHCLRREGIYVWLDLHVGRRFTEKDGLPGQAEVERHGGVARGFNYVNPKLAERMHDFARTYLSHENPYTKARYADDPAVLGVLITNENDITGHYGTQFLPDKDYPFHRGRYQQESAEFSRRVGLSPKAAERTWQAGPAKIVLNELEARFFTAAIDVIRSTRYEGLVSTTNAWGDFHAYDLPALMLGDVLDVHSYGEAGFLETNPLVAPHFADRIAWAQPPDRPLFVTEWNVPFPAADRFAAPLFVAAIAALQGWDATLLYGYRQSRAGPPEKTEQWTAAFDPALMAPMPAAALLVRLGLVAPARKTYRIELDRAAAYYQNTAPETSAVFRGLSEQSRVTLALPELSELAWDRAPAPREGEIVVRDLSTSLLDLSKTEVVSDTGELRRDWLSGVHVVDAPAIQGVQGRVGGRKLSLSTIRFELETPAASVVVVSLDGRALAESRRMLVTAAARVVATAADSLPLLAEPVTGRLVFSTNQPLKFTPLAPDSEYDPTTGRGRPETATRAHEPKDGVVGLALTREHASHWYLVERVEN